LKNIHFRLYQDLYKKGTARNTAVPKEDLHDGTFIDSLYINGIRYIYNNKPIDQSNVKTFTTDLMIRLADSIPSDGVGVIELAWSFPIPTSISNQRRMGRYSDDFFIGLWYPQVAVYDDIRGWDYLPHLGLQEFYNDFNNYDITINVPNGYLVWGTGECINLESVLNETIIGKLNFAKSHDSIVSIISSEDYKNNLRKGNNWHFRAEHVPDFAFAAATNYLWKGTSIVVDQKSKKRVFVDIVYPADSVQYLNSLLVAREAILWSSNVFPGIPFPSEHLTSFFNGSRDGMSMEFPMIDNDGIYSNYDMHNAVVVHEAYHDYMPFYMGFNETMYGWMDEGWVEFLEYKYKADSFSLYEHVELNLYTFYAGNLFDYPMISSTIDLSVYNSLFLQYMKPTINLLLLEELMGEEAFLKATKEFIQVWNGKHPTPMDFIYAFNKFAYEDINWFWKACYFEYGYIDLGIKSVEKNDITIEKIGNIPVSIRLDITYDDNSHEKIYKNLKVWKTDKTEYLIKLNNNKTIQKITLGDQLIPDIDKTNNIYQR
jgi:hypothetical protein